MKDQATAPQTPTLNLSQVRPADIIVMRSSSAQSKAIRIGSCASYSHAIMALGDGMGIEATGGKTVDRIKLDVELGKYSAATLYRHRSMNSDFAGWICTEALKHIGKPYDYQGAARAGVATGCTLTKHTSVGVFIQLVDEMKAKRDGDHDDSFFCSELIVRVYHELPLPLINGSAHTATPGALVKSPYLNLIQELVTA